MLAEMLVRTTWGRRLVRRANATRAAEIVADVLPSIAPGQRVVDVGSGTCDVAALLRERGVDVELCDIRDLSCVDGLRPRLFDGVTLPWPDAAFDVALLINVLHHIRDPDALLAEARRVAARIVVHEDIYDSPAQRAATLIMDSLTNLEFVGHPHANRDDAGWRRAFAALGLQVVEARYKRFWRLFYNANYVVAHLPPQPAGRATGAT